MDKKELYVEKSLKLFLKQGIKRVTIETIATHLNISSKTIYKNFIDKNGLVRECLTFDNQIITQTYQQIIQKENALEALISFYNELAHRLASVNPNYFEDIRKYFPDIWLQMTAHGTQQIQTLLQRGVSSGIFSPHIDTEICAKSISLLIKAVLEDDYFPPQIKERSKLTANVIYPYIRGICTNHGLAEIKYHLQKGEILY